uniref:T9SS type A sorting domain-containing protein n=1 Tax=candidate division WOR-3 bacterium TaxID=2052148 RepID=A0A7C6ECH4_UNCW3
MPPEIYPNPAKTYCAIRLLPTADRQSALGGLKIFNVSGKLIKEVALTGTDREIKISLKGINPGIYFLRLGTETKKFLVVKKGSHPI